MKNILLLISSAILLLGCNVKPPIAKIIPDTTFVHNVKLIDNYSWLKDKTRKDPTVLEYVNAENEYTRKVMKRTEKLQKKLFNEFKNRIKDDDISVPVKIDDYYYYYRKEAKKQYAIYCRMKGSLEAEEEIYLDVNKIAEGYKFFSIIERKISPDHRYLAYGVDVSGAEDYTLVIKDLFTNKLLTDTVNKIGDLAWANDSKTIFYSTEDQAGRTHQIYRHILGNDVTEDELIFTEEDERFWVWVARSEDDNYLILGSGSKTTNERWILDANEPNANFKIIQPRINGHQYYIYPHTDELFILTNNKAVNNRVMKTRIAKPSMPNWQEVIPHRDSVRINLDVFSKYLAIKERVNGIDKLRIINIETMNSYYPEFPDPIYAFYTWNTNFYEPTLRFTYESLTSPYSIYELNIDTGNKVILKQQEIMDTFDSNDYISERIFAKAIDGSQIPISIVYKKDLFNKDGNNPVYLTAYGAYGDNSDPYFSTARLSLLDRGIIYAIAHVRGGKEMGEHWYEQGKMLNKKNTFTDFIACSEFLKQEKYAGELVIDGGSAGGLLMGAVTNMRPDLFQGVIADVPFVDVLNSMMDPTLSAVVSEYEEWGNPNDKTYFNYIRSYSPYDNVTPQDYPHLLVLAGFYDTRVNYWEPAKWVAKLRADKTNDNLLLLQTNMNAGHGGSSGRYDYLKEIALSYTFVLDVLGIKK
ncbi:MAG: S9 family peptidase [Candidatus Cloacimonetes bacterium]|nr:S9 family peptidase [Candidatus Cloacimonadota bacterium]